MLILIFLICCSSLCCLSFICFLVFFRRRRKLQEMTVVVCTFLFHYVCLYLALVRAVSQYCDNNQIPARMCDIVVLTDHVAVRLSSRARLPFCFLIHPDRYICLHPPVSSVAPVSCDAFKSCLMRIPHTSECLGNINAFFKENGISPPKIPPMPKLPTQFSDVTKYLPSLPPELRQEFSRIRLTQIPRNIAQTVSELLPKGAEGAEGAEGSADPALSSLAQSFSDIPQKLSQFPARTQQYFHNVRNRLNSLMPQDA